MGYIKHHTIIVTHYEYEEIVEVHKKAKEIFEKNFENETYEKPFGSKLVSEIIKGLANYQNSFFIAPDGSKEGWGISNNGNNARKEFLDWLQKYDRDCDYIEITFGGDDKSEKIIRSNNNPYSNSEDIY